MRALISVYNKSGVVDLCKKLSELKIELISTGGTGALLESNNIEFLKVESVTNNKEAFNGRMKTISFEISSAILFRRDVPQDVIEINQLGITPIDLVVCNLYDFNQAVKNNSDLETLIELIDIGGPTMIRAGAKNFKSVGVVTDPNDYELVADELLKYNSLSIQTREYLAIKALKLTAIYDLNISSVLNRKIKKLNDFSFSKEEKKLRYGENPHQNAKLCLFNNTNQDENLANAPILQGKEVSYNNYLDSDTAFKCASELKAIFPKFSSVVIVKHGTICGASTGENVLDVLKNAWESDSTSAFGSVIAFTEVVDDKLAMYFSDKFVEVIIAPSFTENALNMFSQKKNIRLISCELKKSHSEISIRSINGGILIQDEDELLANELIFKNVTEISDKNSTDSLLFFGQTIIKYLKSNCLAIIGIREKIFTIIASGVGQPNRIECLTNLITPKIMNINIEHDILFSDAFFPFSDSIIHASNLGVKHIVQPGGSIKDKEVISKCNELGISMKFTGSRHFRH